VPARKNKDLNTFAVPPEQFGLILLVAAVAPLVAAALPARRAARLDVLKATSND
jgi:ABC-type antimicrobial peptide transport system permease subunit